MKIALRIAFGMFVIFFVFWVFTGFPSTGGTDLFEGYRIALSKLYEADKSRDLYFLNEMSNQQLVDISLEFSGHSFVGSVDNVLTQRLIATIDKGARIATLLAGVGIWLTIIITLQSIHLYLRGKLQETFTSNFGEREKYFPTSEMIKKIENELNSHKNDLRPDEPFHIHSKSLLRQYNSVTNCLDVLTFGLFGLLK